MNREGTGPIEPESPERSYEEMFGTSKISRWLFLVVCVAMLEAVLVAGVPSAQAAELDSGGFDGNRIAAKGLTCNPSALYCVGKYEELIDWIRYWDDGRIELVPTEAVRNAIINQDVCVLLGGTRMLFPDTPARLTLVNQIVVERSLDSQFRIQWHEVSASDRTCVVQYVITTY